VQTCALPISGAAARAGPSTPRSRRPGSRRLSLLLVGMEQTQERFFQRGRALLDLFDVGPALDEEAYEGRRRRGLAELDLDAVVAAVHRRHLRPRPQPGPDVVAQPRSGDDQTRAPLPGAQALGIARG